MENMTNLMCVRLATPRAEISRAHDVKPRQAAVATTFGAANRHPLAHPSSPVGV